MRITSSVSVIAFEVLCLIGNSLNQREEAHGKDYPINHFVPRTDEPMRARTNAMYFV